MSERYFVNICTEEKGCKAIHFISCKRLLIRCPSGDLRPLIQPQLLQDVADVVFHGPPREGKLLGDSAVGEPAADEYRDLPLTAGELSRRFSGRWLL
jgi:hypothetical protein